MLLFRKKLSKREKEIKSYLLKHFMFKPSNYDYYVRAFAHRSTTEHYLLSNERLEFLGDSVLGSIVSKVLYDMYQTQTEGELTNLKGKIVSRKFLNYIGDQYDLKSIIKYNEQSTEDSFKFLSGNTLEALIGAIYLDKGYQKTQRIVVDYIFRDFVKEELINEINRDFKSELMIWCQRNRKTIDFRHSKQVQEKKILFTVYIFVEDEKISEATATSKKEATYEASRLAHSILGV